MHWQKRMPEAQHGVGVLGINSPVPACQQWSFCIYCVVAVYGCCVVVRYCQRYGIYWIPVDCLQCGLLSCLNSGDTNISFSTLTIYYSECGGLCSVYHKRTYFY